MVDEFHGGAVSGSDGDGPRLRGAAPETQQQGEDSLFEAAMQLLSAGQSIDQIIANEGLTALPEAVKQKLRARLEQAVAQHRMQQQAMVQQQEVAQEKAASGRGLTRLFSLAAMSGVISQKTLEKIQALFMQQPHLQQQIRLQGELLLKAGAQPDLEFARSTVQIALSPTPGLPGKQRGPQQGF